MKIIIVSPEAFPYVKSGGLADVTYALFTEFRKYKHDVKLFLPYYKHIKKGFNIIKISSLKASMGNRTYHFELLSSGRTLFIANDYFFNRDGLYGDSRGEFPDNAERFAFFCIAVLQSIRHLNIDPDIIHLNDWQTGLIPFYRKEMDMGSPNSSFILTIHNLGYQGLFPPDVLSKLGISRKFFTVEKLEFYGNVNLLKGGIVYSDKITTVSPNYEKEIKSSDLGFGLEGLLKEKGITGILNGIDYNLWSPAKDKFIEKNYDKHDMSGKSVCKSDICRILGLAESSLPLIGVIGRFSTQKGYDLIAQSINDILTLGVNIAILGEGDRMIEKSMKRIADLNPERISLNIGFDDVLARKIYAGSDMFLMPSKYEPCGVAQMIAMRYGSIPIVRMTGGLADTVKDFNPSSTSGTGFLFKNPDRYSMVDCLKRALCVYNNSTTWETIKKNALGSRFDWKESAAQYLELYTSVIEKR